MLTGQKEKPGRAAVYCRVSSDEQAEVVKLGTQLDQIATWSTKLGDGNEYRWYRGGKGYEQEGNQ